MAEAGYRIRALHVPFKGDNEWWPGLSNPHLREYRGRLRRHIHPVLDKAPGQYVQSA
jgi:hypothetical protein